MESYASLHYAFVLMGYTNAYPPPPQVEYGYPYSSPPPPKVSQSPRPPSHQDYNDEYPPPPPSQPNCHSHDHGCCLSFLKGWLAALCCCCMVKGCYF
ncbi:uncharacterized protein [Elaeis guineensis]|uniref:Cysteine-rich and transmembrane domain-containing protein WIH2 n=1 Tax=Elaeis guineensis var. tenera TaxID=51953 RepID=A0A6I9RP69_ELAGV|nr:cysteine-rich and transmembrane domain-containing protein WIH2 [Elaeis guineensis]